jgi:flagellar biosynthesis protein
MTSDTESGRRTAALRYVAGETPAPASAAGGDGRMADRIIARARAEGLPVHESPELVHLLTRLPPASSVPPEVYRAVAEVLVFLMRAADGVPGRDGPPE